MDGIAEMQHKVREINEIVEEIIRVKTEIALEKQQVVCLDAMLQMEKQNAQYLEDSEIFHTEVKKVMMSNNKITEKMFMMLHGPGIQEDIYCAVGEILQHRKKKMDERKETHKKRLEELEQELMKFPESKAMFALREKRDRLKQEREELDREIAKEENEIDSINECQKKMVESYESHVREIEMDIANAEAEIAQLLGESTETCVQKETSLRGSERNIPPQEVKVTPFILKKMEIDETMTEGLNTSDDSFADLTIYEEEPFVIPPAMVAQADQGKRSSSQTTTRSPSVLNETNDSNLAPRQLVGQVDHSHVHSERSDEPNLDESSKNDEPSFVAPLATAPHVHKRKETSLENESCVKKSKPMKSPRQSPRQSPQKEIGSNDYNHSDPSKLNLHLIKSQRPSELNFAIAKPVAQLGITPREVVSQMNVQYSEPESSGHSSAFINVHRQVTDNRNETTPSTSSRSVSKTPTKTQAQIGKEKSDKTVEQKSKSGSAEREDDRSRYPRHRAPAFGNDDSFDLSFASKSSNPFADASKSKMHKQGDNEKSDKKTEQKGGSHSAQRDDDRCHYSASSSFSRRDDNNDEVLSSFGDDASLNFSFGSFASAKDQSNGIKNETNESFDDDGSFFGAKNAKGQRKEQKPNELDGDKSFDGCDFFSGNSNDVSFGHASNFEFDVNDSGDFDD